MKSLLLAVVLALGAGCASIDHHEDPPAGWPRLATTVHVVGMGTILERCYSTLSLGAKLMGSIPLACAWVDLDRRRCDIYATSWAPAAVLEHEHDHCAGRDHEGESTMRDLLARWLATGAR